jgi:MFS family permease
VKPRAGGGSLALFRIPDFRLLWLIGLALFVVRWLETIAVGVYTYAQTDSAFIVSMMSMLRLLPMALFGAFIGVAAERLERRSALLVIIASLALGALMLVVLASAGRLAIWQLAAGSFLNGVGWAADNPVRRVMIGEAAGAERMSLAMSLDVGANTASRMLGPTLGGGLFALVGIGGTFTVSLAVYAAAFLAALGIRLRNAGALPAAVPVLARIGEGLRLAWADPRLRGTLFVTILYNLFGWPFTSMVPVIGRDSLGLGPEGVGLLASMDGVGALVGAVLMARFSSPASFRAAYVGGCMLFFAMIAGFALAPAALPAGLALMLTGLGGAGYSIMQATLIYLAAPAEMRSRMLGVLSVCIGLGPIGFVALGLLADAVGAPLATAASGLAGVIALAASRRVWRHV